MSIFGKIGSVLKKVTKSPLLGIAAAAVPGIGIAASTVMRTIGTVGAAARTAGPVVSAVRTGAIAAGGMLPPIGGAAARTLGRVLPGIGRVGGMVAGGAGALVRGGKGLVAKYPRSARVLAELGLVAVGGLVFDAAGNLMGRRAPARRINPCNAKAARRACRRLKATHRLLQEIERQLPRRVVHAPAGGGFKRKRKC